MLPAPRRRRRTKHPAIKRGWRRSIRCCAGACPATARRQGPLCNRHLSRSHPADAVTNRRARARHDAPHVIHGAGGVLVSIEQFRSPATLRGRLVVERTPEQECECRERRSSPRARRRPWQQPVRRRLELTVVPDLEQNAAAAGARGGGGPAPRLGAYVRRPAQTVTAPAGRSLADPEGNESCVMRSAADRASTG